MSTFRHYDETTGEWLVDAAGNAENIELNNEILQDEEGKSISVHRGFQKLNNKISQLEHHLAWIYQNGAKGGSGGGGTGGGGYSIEVEGGQTVFYTTSNSLSLKIQINSGGARKLFRVLAINTTTGAYIINGTQSVYSQQFSTITLDNLTSDCSVSLQAYDNSDNYTPQITIYIRVGAINISQVGSVSPVFYIGQDIYATATFQVQNKTGEELWLLLFDDSNSDPLTKSGVDSAINKIVIPSTQTSFTNYQIQLHNFMNLNLVGKTYNFKVVAYSPAIETASGNLHSQYFSNTITTAPGDNLAITLSGIALTPEDAVDSQFQQGGSCRINATFWYRYVTISTFYYRYDVYQILNGEENKIYSSEDIGTASRNTTTSIQFLLRNFTTEGYYKIVIEGSEDEEDFNASISATATAYFTVIASATGNLKNYKGALIYHYGAFNPPSSGASNSVYNIETTGDYGISLDTFPHNQLESVTLTLQNRTDTTGFTSTANNVQYINLSGSTYATIEEFTSLLPRIDNYMSTLLGNGFFLQTTYKFTQSNPVNQTILSLGTYSNGELTNGFEISSEQIKIKVGTQEETIEAPIIGENWYDAGSTKKTDQITVGLNCWMSEVVTEHDSIPTYYFAIYIDGTLTKCLSVSQTDLASNWAFGDKLYLGCRSDKTNQANCYIYDIRLYAQKQSSLSLVYNFISAIEQANLNSEGEVDSELDGTLRKKNFFDTERNVCILCDNEGEYLTPSEMLQLLANNYSEYNLDYPIVYIEEISQTSDMYRIVNKTNFAANDAEAKTTWPVKVTIYSKYGKLEIFGETSEDSPTINIQGTSTLAYNVKNFELILGTLPNGIKRLLKINGWLPENEFTLKADVVDSSHSNNVVIGNWINNSGFFNNVFPESESASIAIRNKIKHTSEGFPCLVFVKYANSGAGAVDGIGMTDFFGVYNFNLGRYAYHNLNLAVLDSYEETKGPDEPEIITNYVVNENTTNKIYSLEVKDNFADPWLLFQQANRAFTEEMLDNRSNNDINNLAYSCITDTLYTQLAQAYQGDLVPKLEYALDGTIKPVEINGVIQYWNQLDSTGLREGINQVLNINCLYRYFITALVFGMVDSTCKNMVFRTWNASQSASSGTTDWAATWFTCFYDMDSSMRLNNAGGQTVPYDVHTNNYFNIESGGITTAGDSRTTGIEWNVPVTQENSLNSYGGVNGNRMWDVIRRLELSGVAGYMFLGEYYWELRSKYIQDPDKFIDEYFAQYIKKTGSILYNYDYSKKYISYGQVWDNEKQQLVSNVSNKQSSFLYGTRLNAIRTWFKKRINFLDSVYLEYLPTNLTVNLSGYLGDKEGWGARQTKESTITPIQLRGAQRYKVYYSVSSNDKNYLWVYPETQLVYFKTQANSNNTTTLYGFNGIKEIKEFRDFGFIGLTQEFKFTLLENFNTSNLTIEGLQSYSNLQGMPNLTVINFSGVKRGPNDTSNPSLVLTNNLALKSIDISNSDISSLQLSSASNIESINMGGAKNIVELPPSISGQSGLQYLNLSGTNIKDLYGDSSGSKGLANLPLLTTLELPEVVEKVAIINCGVTEIVQTWSDTGVTSPLQVLYISNCPHLETIDLSGQNNLTELTINNCPNLKYIKLRGVNIKNNNIAIDFTTCPKLRSLDISNTTLFTTLDLSNCPDINSLIATNCTNLVTVICTNNNLNPIELQSSAFMGCGALQTLIGNFLIQGSGVFEDCYSLTFDSLLDSGDLVISFDNISNLSKTFKNCRLLGSQVAVNKWPINFIHSLGTNVDNISEMFAGTSSNFQMPAKLFARYVDNQVTNLNVTNISHIFENTNISGRFYSESEDGGFFKYMPRLLSAESAFANSSAERYIDNDFFHNTVAERLTNVDYMFSDNFNIKAVVDTNANSITLGTLHSKDFFINLKNCKHGDSRTSGSGSVPNPDWPYPYSVFAGTNIKMTVDVTTDGKPFLFHVADETIKDKRIYLANALYDGIHLILENCDYSYLFGGGKQDGESVSKTITDGEETYYIPKFVQITSPFTASEDLKLNIESIDGSIFFDPTTQYLLNPFAGMHITTVDSIPDTIFDGADTVISLQGFFAGLNLNNLDGEVYDFAEHDIFADCKSLKNISSIFQGCNNFRMRLASNMFKNCQLEDVSNAFADSRIIEQLPEQLFYMEDSEGNIRHTIKYMNNVFSGCYNLGYSEDYQYREVVLNLDGNTTGWYDHVVANDLETIDDYAIPEDLFWYCTKNADIANVLGQMFWNKQVAEEAESGGIYKVITLEDTYVGPKCTIPINILNGGEALKQSDTLKYVFAGTKFLPSGVMDVNTYERGNLYPETRDTNGVLTDSLLFGMNKLKDITGMFMNTIVDAQCMINKDIFKYDGNGNLCPLTNISYVWANCKFSYHATNIEAEPGSAQLAFDMFDSLQDLSDASYLFQNTSNGNYGLKEISDSMFIGLEQTGSLKSLNISGMFSYNNFAVDACNAPLFTSCNLTTGANTYLMGISPDRITNRVNVKARGIAPNTKEWEDLV